MELCFLSDYLEIFRQIFNQASKNIFRLACGLHALMEEFGARAIKICNASHACLTCCAQAATMLAKQLVALRKQKTRNIAAKSKMGSIGHQATARTPPCVHRR